MKKQQFIGRDRTEIPESGQYLKLDPHLGALSFSEKYDLIWFDVLVSEVYNLEIYLYGLDPTFFGSSTLPEDKPSKIRQREYTTKSRENFKYCDCEKCAEVDRLYPKSSERIT